MRKHLIATASLLALGLAGPALANDSDIEQIGLSNTANVDQTGGTGNDSDILQISDGVNVPTLADVTQSGTGNVSTIEQGRNESTPDRSGQTATVVQGPDGNTSNIVQRGNLNTASVDQAGGSTSDILQTGADNDASVIQDGPGNMSTITQGASFGMATVEQYGSDNTSTITQTGSVNSSVAGLVLQDGHGNESIITQESADPARNQLAEVTQTTDGNFSEITQGGTPASGLSDPATGNEAFVMQTVQAGNVSTITQTGAGNTATVNQ